MIRPRITFLELRELLFGRDLHDLTLEQMCEQCPLAECDENSLWCQYRLSGRYVTIRPNDIQRRMRRELTKEIRAGRAVADLPMFHGDGFRQAGSEPAELLQKNEYGGGPLERPRPLPIFDEVTACQ